MIISKLYNKSNKTNAVNTGDPRVLTPSSIPIFILPPTLDSFNNGNKPDLNDSCDCWSIADEDVEKQPPATSTTSKSQQYISTAGSMTPSNGANKTASVTALNGSGGRNSRSENRLLKIDTNSDDKYTTTKGNKSKNRKRNSDCNYKQVYSAAAGAGANADEYRATSSLENIYNKLDTATLKPNGNRNSSITSTCSTPAPAILVVAAAAHMKNKSISTNLAKRNSTSILNNNTNGYCANENQTNTDFLCVNNGSQNNSPSHQNQSQQNPSCSKSLVKTLFRNGFLNMHTVNNETDELKSKENYCNLWVLHTGNETNDRPNKSKSNLNLLDSSSRARMTTTPTVLTNHSSPTNLSVEYLSKSPSYINFNVEPVGKNAPVDYALKSEEQLQREYLANLLYELEKSQNEKAHTSTNANVTCKKDKRSKSETLLTLSSLWNRGATNGLGNVANSNGNRATASKRSSTSSSNQRLNSIFKQILLGKGNSKSNFLDVKDSSRSNMALNDNRKFSLRNFFRQSNPFSAKSSQIHLEVMDANNSNDLERMDSLQKQRQQMFHTSKGENSNRSGASDSSSFTTNSNSANNTTRTQSFKLLPVSSVTGSVIKFQNNKLANKLDKNNSETDDIATRFEIMRPASAASSSTRALSDPNVNKISNLKLLNDNLLRIPSSGDQSVRHLSLIDRRDMFKGSKSISSTNLDDENDMDKVFNDYLSKRTRNNTSGEQSDTTDDRVGHDECVRPGHDTTGRHNGGGGRGLFGFFFKSSKNNSTGADDELHEMSSEPSNRRSRRSRTLDSTSKNRTSFFARTKNSFMNRKRNGATTAPTCNIMEAKNRIEIDNERIDLDILTDVASAANGCADNGSPSEMTNSPTRQADDRLSIRNPYDPQKKTSLNSNFKFDLNNVNFSQLEKDFCKKHKADGANLSKNESIRSNDSIYLDASLVTRKQSRCSPMNKSSSMTNNFKVNINKSKSTDMKLDRTTLADLTTPVKKKDSKLTLTVYVDVSFEKLQQHLDGHLISINLKNLRVEPLMEINHIKAKLNYLSIELIDGAKKQPDAASNGGGSPLKMNKSSPTKKPAKPALLAKINKIKSKKCKFDNNLKNFSKPMDFDLVNDHFMNVTEEATNIQIRKLLRSPPDNSGTGDSSSNTNEDQASKSGAEKTYLFLFLIELHSYIPVSRKILSSTFRKKKRIFRGQCQIHENFISSTQFTKQFITNEV